MLQETCSPSVLLFPPAVPGCLLFPAARCSRPPAVHGRPLFTASAPGVFTGNNDLLTTGKHEENTEEGQVLRFLSGKSVSVVKSS